MEIDAIKKIIKRQQGNLSGHIKKIEEAENYYRNKNDITRTSNPLSQRHEEEHPDNPLRVADNRVSMPWHRLLVQQKASYTMATPPTFDVGDKKLNGEITKILGDAYPKIAKDLCVNASNAGIAWLHVWIDENNQNFFEYEIVDSKQIIPIYSKKLKNKLEGLLRVYEDYDEKGDTIEIYEYWNDKELSTFSKKKSQTVEDLTEYNSFKIYDVATNMEAGATNTIPHEWERIPFIPFRNSSDELSDLDLVKGLIDVHDKVYAGFVNDLDDIQEIIFVLTNYSGTEKTEFLEDLQKFKTVKVEDDGDGKGGVDTLSIDIPTEAREKLLEMTRELIFVNGQGVDPQKNIGQNNSGAALKYMYSLLELKASSLETEFRPGLSELARMILRYSDADPDVEINQTWVRTAVNNDLERADVVSKLAPISSKESIAKSNPLVENWEDELKKLDKEQLDDDRMANDYRNPEVNADGEEN